ncbi:MAG: TIGR02757 family protein [Planctomycetota bacterium]|nr:MAG: TIGR02757 family protein [Planctomycetota bacterium]
MRYSKVQIRDVLESLYGRYNHRTFIKPDPLQFVYRYSDPADKEIAGFLSAGLAYGRVEQIEKSLTELFGRMGESPYAFVRGFGKSERKKLQGFKHRFTTGRDIADLLALLKNVLAEFGSIEIFFARGYNSTDKNIIAALSRFCDSLLDMHAKTGDGSVRRGLRYLLAGPAGGSACKRLNLFLRWMVRKDDVDPGLWTSIDKSKLIVPVDVHMARLCRILGFHGGKTASLSTTVKITKSFAEIAPADPVKYDFALSRIGILENCTGRHRSGCEFCELFKFCFQKQGEQ